MKEKRKPERMCIACRKRGDKQEFIRLVKEGEGAVKIDATLKAEGRGAYICKDKSCIELAEKKNAISRAFKANVSREIYTELIKLVD